MVDTDKLEILDMMRNSIWVLIEILPSHRFHSSSCLVFHVDSFPVLMVFFLFAIIWDGVVWFCSSRRVCVCVCVFCESDDGNGCVCLMLSRRESVSRLGMRVAPFLSSRLLRLLVYGRVLFAPRSVVRMRDIQKKNQMLLGVVGK